MVRTLDPCARAHRKDADDYGDLISMIGEARLTDSLSILALAGDQHR